MVKKNQGQLTHIDQQGRARMVEVTGKSDTVREAIARGRVKLSPNVLQLIERKEMKKGDPLQVARLAGIMAAKKTSEWIPLCHPLILTNIEVDVQTTPEGVLIESRVVCVGKTGVEMEALTAVSAAALTIYDMCKAVDKKMVIEEIMLVKKSGGRSGTFVHPAAQ
ncbi:MAG: cyclic pyranopterin monophosphate synthase MoaC [bacterium]